jgi:hypothetical protein
MNIFGNYIPRPPPGIKNYYYMLDENENGVYEGEFNNNPYFAEEGGEEYIREGKGIMRYTNGDVYDGKWDDDYKHGHGIMTYANGDVYTGEWNMDMIQGYGIMKYANGDVYTGEFTPFLNNTDDYIRSFRGNSNLIQYEEGNRLSHEDETPGKGTMKYINGDIYIGEWVNDLRHGYGTMTYTNGDVYEGEWKNDLPYGNNEYISSINPSINQQSFKHIPNDVKLYDPIMMEEENLHEYLKTKDSLVFIFGNNYFPLNKDTIRIQIENPSNIVYECYKSGTLKTSNINKKIKYLRLNSLGMPGDFIPLKSIENILSEYEQIFNMVETEKVLVTVVSDEVLNHQGSHVSASHCQVGQGGKVYDLNKKIIRAYSKRNRKHIRSITKKKKGYLSKSKSSKLKSSIFFPKYKSRSRSKSRH